MLHSKPIIIRRAARHGAVGGRPPGPYEIVEPLGDLKQVLERGPIPVGQALASAEQVAKALEAIHGLSVCVVNRSSGE